MVVGASLIEKLPPGSQLYDARNFAKNFSVSRGRFRPTRQSCIGESEDVAPPEQTAQVVDVERLCRPMERLGERQVTPSH